MFLFSISMFLDFFYLHSKRRTAEAQNEILGKMAYTDTMTGLYNRRRADEELDLIREHPDAAVFV